MIGKKSLVLNTGTALLFAAYAQAAPFMYIPTGISNEIAVVDLNRDNVVDRIGELENAHGLTATPDGEILIVGSMQRASATDAAAAEKPAAVKAEDHTLHHAAGESVAASYVSIVQRANLRVIRRVAVPGLTHHTAVSPDGKIAIAVHTDLGGVSIIDLARMETVKTFKTGTAANYAVFVPNGRRLYVSNAGDASVSEIDTTNWEIKRQLHVGNMPEHMIISAHGEQMYVLNVLDGTVSQINLSDGRMAHTFKVGKTPHAGALSGNDKWLFISNNGDGTVSRIDLMTNEIRTVPLGADPYHVDYVSAKNTLYVTSKTLPKMWAINPDTLRVRAEIDLGKGIGHQAVVLDK